MLRPGRGGGAPGGYSPQQPRPGGGYGSPAPGGYSSPTPPGGYYGSPNPGGGGTYGAGGGTNGGPGGGGYGGSSGGGGGYGHSSQAYGGYAGPGSDSGEFKDHKPRAKTSSASPLPPGLAEVLKQPMAWLAILCLILFVMTARYRSQQSLLLRQVDVKSLNAVTELIESLRSDKSRLEREAASAKRKQDSLQKRYDSLVKEHRQAQKDRDELRVKYESPEKRTDDIRQAAREDAWKKQVQLLQQATSRESRRAATEKFGPGPHRVQINVVFPNEEKERSFVVEMAPLESMPHAVHLFLEQVDHNLWTNAWFYLNGPHVLQGGPQYDGDLDEDEHEDERALALRPFKELQLDELVFPEYSEDFPHVPWSLGFTGRPGGPDWYINKSDNTVGHGPGGQFQHDLEEFADPCFAKVVEGFGTLEALFDLPTEPRGTEYEWFLKDAVHVVGAKLLTPKPNQKTETSEAEKPKSEEEKPKESEQQTKLDEVGGEKRPRFHRPDIDHLVAP